MIWQPARVIDAGSGHLTLAFSGDLACSRCASGKGCGAGLLGGLLMRSTTRIVLPARIDARAGDRVRVGVAPERLAFAATVHYGVPLAAFLVGALLAHGLSPSEAVRDIAALIGGLFALVLSVSLLQRFAAIAVNPIIERLSCVTDDTKSSHS